MKQDARSVLKLEKLVFDKLLFERKGFSSENNFEFNMESQISKRSNEEIYKVTLILHGKKPDEYIMEISLTGFFSFGTDTSISDEDKKELISKNTLAILMPYLRSEVSILTAQPEVECIVLPPFNINNLMGEARE
ncbi:protein-export chaperone SecB [Flavonifractor plautii]|uniref:protein-export chaperone SecB n=1 Tax=Flavonifractor plautii TaxID=292800 RepID=UPI000B372734|nr:protein-export chaperone SecB [Flavonifractor plautii]MCB5377027.1 protein-export chaperone SecB [Flavonifractor plautii]OUO83704.1 Preprotein translocase subunit SecB [Flavonifractor plautii]